MEAKEHDQQTFYKLIRNQRKTADQAPSELYVNGTVYKEDLLEAWSEHFSTLAIPSKNPNFDQDYLNQVIEDVKHIHHICSKLPENPIPITVFEVARC